MCASTTAVVLAPYHGRNAGPTGPPRTSDVLCYMVLHGRVLVESIIQVKQAGRDARPLEHSHFAEAHNARRIRNDKAREACTG